MSGANPFHEDFFALEPLLLARLKDRIPLAKALSAWDLEGVKEQTQQTPAVHVLFNGFSVGAESRGDTLEQRWMTVAVTRNLRQKTAADGDTVRIHGGQLAAQIINALRRWPPLPGFCDPLALATPPAAAYQNGFLYVPVAWTARIVYPRDHR